ncbi:molybdenum cofactor biosynthesis protein B [Mycobacterium sp. PO1]|nr:molybdenum cofactor biosynthesis protein B [Mycobacterium sp. PO1]
MSITNYDFGDCELIDDIDEPSDDFPDLFTAYVWRIGYRALENHVLGELSRCTFGITRLHSSQECRQAGWNLIHATRFAAHTAPSRR